MNPHPKKGQIIRPFEMPNNLLEAYKCKLKEFGIKPREGARYDGKQIIHYYTAMDEGAKATFCITEKDND